MALLALLPSPEVAAGRKIDFAGYTTLGPVVNAQEGTSGTIPDTRPPLDPGLEWLHFWNVGAERLQPVPAKSRGEGARATELGEGRPCDCQLDLWVLPLKRNTWG